MPALPLHVDLLDDFQTCSPSPAAVLDRLRQNFSSRRAAKSQRPQPISMDLPIEADDAPAILSLGIPVGAPCPRCEGTGRMGYFSCAACEGHGMLWTTARLDIPLPDPPADSVAVSLEPLHIHNLHLLIRLHPA